ncbi:substrate-binding domain-containing protein [Acidimicrobiales bacterium]|nr:substrate-binding domain-containing protein [bacterium]MDC1388947.1 substrate-binding domain-containing protein [Acidimicrobiales bacterium]
MNTPRSSAWRIASLVLMLALIAVACGDSGDVTDGESASSQPTADQGTTEETTIAPVDPSDLEGEIFISGSSTVEPISVRVAELFEEVAPGVFVDVEGPGTGDGFKKFCSGETDISDASRQIKDAEAEECAAAGIEFTEVLVGIDGIGVMTSENNTAVECVTFGDLYGLVGPESDGVTSWADANDITGVGLPDAPLTIFGPGEESGTYDSFIEIVIEDIAEERGQEASTRSTYSPSADDNVILSGIQSSDTSLGWVGFAFAANAEGSKLLQVDGGDGCVEATPATIASNEYPVSRNLYIYVNNAKAAANPALAGFVDFYTTTGLIDAVSQVGYVQLASAAMAETQAAWAARGADVTANESASGSDIDLSDLEGEIFISGSSTVEPISVRVAELFEEVAPGVFVDVEGPGTGDGFKKFCSGETDISDASRQIKDAEAEECAAAGIEFTEVLVGIDGIGVMTSENNTAVECVTFGDLYGLVGPESDGVTSWADANDITGVGLPDAPLTIFGPGEESGTYDSFIEIVIEDIAEERGQEASTRSTYSPSADDNVILSGIQSSDTSLGWVGFAFAANAEGSKLLQVDGGDGCVEATPATIASNEYPVSRNLYIYVNNAKAAANPALAGFVDFYVTTGLNEAVASVGYVELADTAKAEVASAWQG